MTVKCLIQGLVITNEISLSSVNHIVAIILFPVDMSAADNGLESVTLPLCISSTAMEGMDV